MGETCFGELNVELPIDVFLLQANYRINRRWGVSITDDRVVLMCGGRKELKVEGRVYHGLVSLAERRTQNHFPPAMAAVDKRQRNENPPTHNSRKYVHTE